MKLVLSCIGIALLAIGCKSRNNGDNSLDLDHEIALLTNQSIINSNQDRRFHLYLPGNPGSASIVLLLHGNGGSNDQILGLSGTKAPYKEWLDVAQQENIILVIPNGVIGPNGKRGWNDCRNDAPTNPDSDDVFFINSLIDFVKTNYGSRESRVFSVGTSNGGFMSMRLAAEIPESIEAIATIVASRPVNSECKEASEHMPVLIMNGTDDPILPYNGGQINSDRGEVYSTAETVNYWKNRNLSNATPLIVDVPNINIDDDSTINRYSYKNAAGDTVVEHYEITNGGHTEPSIAERYGNIFKLIVGNQNADVEMAKEVWEFFDSL